MRRASHLSVLGLVAFFGCEAAPETPAVVAGSSASADARRAATEIEIPPSLRGLPVGPLDPSGRPSVVPCATCHEMPDADVPLPTSARGLAGPHRGLTVDHGGLVCASCHHPVQRDALRLADGRAIALVDAMRLCAQCHGPQARAYEHGAHGGMRGHWDVAEGPRTRNHCVSCHDPHGPNFGSFTPMPGPRDRFFPRPEGAEHE